MAETSTSESLPVARLLGRSPAIGSGVPEGLDAAVLGIQGDLGLGYLRPLAELAGMTAPDDPGAAQRWFADSMPVAFLYHARGLQGMNRRVLGVRMDLRGELPTVHEWRVTR